MNLGEALRIKAREQGIQHLSKLTKEEELERKRVYQNAARREWRNDHNHYRK